MGELAEWGKKNNKYLTIANGEFVEVIFEGARVAQSTFDPEKETVQYKLSGQIFNSASRVLSTAMDTIPIGSKIRLGRTGEKNKTKYSVEVIG